MIKKKCAYVVLIQASKTGKLNNGFVVIVKENFNYTTTIKFLDLATYSDSDEQNLSTSVLAYTLQAQGWSLTDNDSMGTKFLRN